MRPAGPPREGGEEDATHTFDDDHRAAGRGGRFFVPTPETVVDAALGALGPALLALEDGTVLPGVAWGAGVAAGGDLVANTGQTGYQEVCTDPSYAGQVVVMTHPQVGNHGWLPSHDQSRRPWLGGLVVAHATAARHDQVRELADLLRAAGVPAIAGVDTRRLARHLRLQGSMRALITAPGETDMAPALARVRALPRWEDQDFVEETSASGVEHHGGRGPVVAVVDYGLKAGIVRELGARGARVRVFPHTAAPSSVLARDVAAVVLSPGPGDPLRLSHAVALARAVIADGRPLLGICLGHQIVGLAAGARTRRLRYGHHAANHPVVDVDTGTVRVTAQNHEVEVLPDGLEDGFYVSQRNLNDGSVEGLRHRQLPIETVQYHPEGSPGPLDALDLFARFLARAGLGRAAA